MDTETKQLLVENLNVAKQNNEMLVKLVRGQKMATIYRVVYWTIIILSTFGAYYFIQPFLGTIFNVYTGGVSGESGVNVSDVLKNLSDKEQMKNLLDSLK